MRLTDRATVAIWHMIQSDQDSARFPMIGATIDELQRIRQAAADVAKLADDVLQQALDGEAAITGYGHMVTADGKFRDATYGEYLAAHGVTVNSDQDGAPAAANGPCGRAAVSTETLNGRVA